MSAVADTPVKILFPGGQFATQNVTTDAAGVFTLIFTAIGNEALADDVMIVRFSDEDDSELYQVKYPTLRRGESQTTLAYFRAGTKASDCTRAGSYARRRVHRTSALNMRLRCSRLLGMDGEHRAVKCNGTTFWIASDVALSQLVIRCAEELTVWMPTAEEGGTLCKWTVKLATYTTFATLDSKNRYGHWTDAAEAFHFRDWNDTGWRARFK